MTLNLVQAWSRARSRLEAAGLPGPVIDARLLVEAAAGATRADIVGDPYRPQRVAELERLMLDTQAYDSVTVGLAPKSDPDGTRPVIVSLADRAKRSLEVSAGYSTSEGEDFQLSISRFNWFHRADTVTGDKYDDKTPYVFGANVDLVELPITWLLDDFPHFEFVDRDCQGLASASKVEEIWRDEFDYAHQNAQGGLFNLTMHPQVIGRGYRMMMLERLIRALQAGGAVFMTMEQAMKEWLARKQAPKAAE